MATIMGHQYWAAYQRAVAVTTVVPSAKTKACEGSDPVHAMEAVVTQCTK